MYLNSIILNDHCFKNAELDFRNADGAAQQWTSIIGDSGFGKSSLLREIYRQVSGRFSGQYSIAENLTSISYYDANRKMPGRLTPNAQNMLESALLSAGLIVEKFVDIKFENDEYSLIHVVGQSVITTRFSELSSSSTSTLAWLMNLVADIDANSSDRNAEGMLVLIDDLDLHASPSEQVKFPYKLKEFFPNIQFITSVKNPASLVSLLPREIVKLTRNTATGLSEFAAVDPDTGRWIGTQRSDLASRVKSPDPRAMSATELYQAYCGVEQFTLYAHGDLIRTYTALAANPYRNAYQNEKMIKCQESLCNLGISELASPCPIEDPGL